MLIAIFRWALVSWVPSAPDNQAPLIARLLELLDELRRSTGWAYPVAVVLVVAGIVLRLIGIWWHRHDDDADRVAAAVATVLRVPTASIRLRAAGWTRGGLVRGRIHYPRGAVISDLSADLATTLVPFAAGSLKAQWHRRTDRFVLSPQPPRPPRVEEEHAAAAQVFVPLNLLLAGVTVDQHQTRVDEQGTLEQMVLTYPPTTRDIADGFRQRVQAVLDAKAPSPNGYWSLLWDPAESRVTIRPCIPLPTTAPYPLTPPQDRTRIPVGLGDGGVEMDWNPARNPHMLVVGPTGTGKTIYLNTIIIGALARAWSVSIADPKELSFRGFDPRVLAPLGLPVWPGIRVVATTDRAMECLIDDAYQEMRRRYEQIRNFEVNEQDLQPHLLVIDEVGELVERLHAYQNSDAKLRDLQAEAVAEGRNPDEVVKPKGTKNPELSKIWSILRLGRQCGVYVVLAAQRPDVSFIPGEARSNLIARAGLGRLGGAALEMVFGTRAIQQRVHEIGTDPVTGRRTRIRISGRATVDLGSGPATLQGFWTPDPAKAITGESSSSDRALITDLRAFVNANQGGEPSSPVAVDAGPPTTSGGTVTSAWTLPIHPTAPQELESSDHESVGSSPACDEIDLDQYRQSRADQLRLDQVALLEVDSEPTFVRITEIEPDPFGEDDELQVTYEIVGDDPRSGQLGVTTLSAAETVAVQGG